MSLDLQSETLRRHGRSLVTLTSQQEDDRTREDAFARSSLRIPPSPLSPAPRTVGQPLIRSILKPAASLDTAPETCDGSDVSCKAGSGRHVHFGGVCVNVVDRWIDPAKHIQRPSYPRPGEEDRDNDDALNGLAAVEEKKLDDMQVPGAFPGNENEEKVMTYHQKKLKTLENSPKDRHRTLAWTSALCCLGSISLTMVINALRGF